VFAPEETALVIEDCFAGMNLLPAAFSFDHRINKAFEFFTSATIDTKPMQRIGMHKANFSWNSSRQTGLKHCFRFGQGIRANHSRDMQTDF
jgi:hypothetical protein